MLLTYSQQLDLVKNKLAVVSRNEELRLDTFKCHRRVMYDYLWKKHPECLECRGHTYDIHTGELVIAAPRKSFNYLEDGWWEDVPLDTEVEAYKKFNGFMATLSVHNGQAIIGTTGSTKSNFVGMAKEKISKMFNLQSVGSDWDNNYTWLFEIVHEADPHIVHETPGAKYLGCRRKDTSEFTPVACDASGGKFITTLGLMLEIVKQVKHEGFMLYDKQGDVCKLKSPYYVGKKKLMRANKDRVDQMYNQTVQFLTGMPDMWHDAVIRIVQRIDKRDWLGYSEQHRRQVLEDFLG